MENPYQRQQQQFMNRGQDRRGFDDRGGFDDFGNFPYAPGEIRTQDVSAPPEGVMDTMEDFKNDPRITSPESSNTGSFYGSQNSFHAPPEGVIGTMGGYGGFLGSAGSGQSQEEFNRTGARPYQGPYSTPAGPTFGDMQYRGATPGGSTNDILKSLVGLGADPNNTAQRTMQDAMNAQKNQQTSSNTMLDGSRPPQPPMQPPFNPYQKFNYGGGRGGYKNDRRFGGRLPQSAIDDPVGSYHTM